MHFTTLFILKGEKLEDYSREEIENIFCERFCYCCGETKPKYKYWCDWFQIGGRWGDMIKATKGLHCEPSWANDNTPSKHGIYSVVDIQNMTEPLDKQWIFSIATKSRIYCKNEDWQSGGIVDKAKYERLLDDINNKRINGIIAFFDCHD